MFITVVAPALAGALLAACGLPQPWSALSALPLALVFALIARAPTARAASAAAFWAGLAYFTVQLFWLPVSFSAGFGAFGAVMFVPVILLQAGFWALTAWLTARAVREPLARGWALAGAWTLLSYARTLGPLPFPWADVGYTLLPTPLVQVADLVGVHGLNLLVALTASALVAAVWGAWRPLLGVLVLLAGGTTYGVIAGRAPLTAGGPEGRALLLRTDIDSFEKATQSATVPLVEQSRTLSAARRPDEIVVWSETALPDPSYLPQFPAPGLSGLGFFTFDERGQLTARMNTAVSITPDVRIGARYDKAHPVPFGELFPLRDELNAVYAAVEQHITHFPLASTRPGEARAPLTLNGVAYGTYICYDSIFPAVTRALAHNGAQVLVNVSNDGWFVGWGVEQHLMMGRVRAIETRRYVLRSVNRGVAAVIDDLGRVVQRLDHGEGVLHARFVPSTAQTVYVRVGDAPALVAAALLVLLAVGVDGRARRRRLY
ncbi:apolipoprotein N-acyltransferase [Deinococcus maricopensis]|uniref:Apolipoprotein N-acyltransferase n=1 Tax=Deinococcus maricopensis (strain DSM 21211 / LMG 22137 / NRRL B-23946 / LB-34) TaxID=709986 RepID=E8U8V0_DEIML|nr:apolipoprotein N-acyltransferase [Deinococcus maricopensis]ADV67489.1 Apolipoprotein N-acyltransferase [Deinococcus maricopensis DSM 21211]